MYEMITFEVIMERMLNRISDKFDKREASIIWNALAPAAVELQNMYIEFDNIIKESFADTASYEFLQRRAEERGLYPHEPTNAILKAEFNKDVPIGSRFSIEELNYIVTEKIDNFNYKIECETKGIIGNQYFGTMIPVEYIDGLTYAEIIELLIPGEDLEDIEDFRQRYFDSFNTKTYGGNKRDYIEKTNSIEGVGSTKPIPHWNGGGTVKIIILDSEYNKATQTLIDRVQGILDPVPYGGMGVGVAPIGHVVTVTTAAEIPINISIKITFNEGYNWENTSNAAIGVIENYLLELRKDWETSTEIIVRIAQIETRLLAIEGIIDIEETKINGVDSNLIIDVNNIPVMGVIENE
jgi:uncharacterized phage protein gp47/JayE